MSIPRLLTAVLTVVQTAILVGAAALDSPAAAEQQDPRSAPPATPAEPVTGPPVGPATGPVAGERTAKPIEVDPMFDATLIEIREKVSFHAEQWAALLERYRVLRVDQREVIRARTTEMAKERAEALANGDERARREADRGAIGNFDDVLSPLNERFVADVFGIIDEPLHEAWAACVAGLDLMTQPRYFGQRPEMRWRDPALGPKVGEMAPAFALETVGGRKLTLEMFRGAPVGLLFGSTSSPDFRRTVEQAEMLQRAYGEKVRWIIIYTFEAHPTDGWALKLNEKLGIEIPQHKSYEDRLALALAVHDEKAPSCFVFADEFDDAVTKRYFGHPNRFYLIDGEGRIVLKQVRFDERESTVVLYELLTGQSASVPLTKPPAPP